MLKALHSAFLLPLLASPLLWMDTNEEKAQKIFNKALFAYEHGRYGESVKVYRNVVRKYPDTEAGKLAAKRSAPNAVLGFHTIVDHGPSENRVDIALMGDGFTIKRQLSFDKWAENIPAIFEQQRLFDEYYSYLNFHAFHIVSADSNVSGYGREESTALGGLTLKTNQGHVGVDRKLVLAALDELPEHDGQALVYVRAGILGTATYGVAAIGGRNSGTTIHEWGHSFGRLNDEYTTITHDRGAVRNGINIANHEVEEELPWAHWIEARAKGVGAYEGGAGRERGAWRPTASGCVMQSGEFFCPPCREALLLSIYALVDPIDDVNFPPHPFAHPASLTIEDQFEFEVSVMRPKKHNLEVSWWLTTVEHAPQPPKAEDPRYVPARGKAGDRRDRGALVPIELKPTSFSKTNKSGVHKFLIKAKHFKPGRYRLVCRVKDSTKMAGEKLPWVLRDDDGLLESERAWWITIPER